MFVLNVLAFMLIGMQLRPDLVAPRRRGADGILHVAAGVLATVILARIAWVMLLRRPAAGHDRVGRFGAGQLAASADVQARHRRVLVRHARDRHAGGGVRAAGKFSLSRPDPADRVCRGAGIAGDPGPDLAAADHGATAGRRESGGGRGRPAPAPRPIARRWTKSTAIRRRKPKSCGWNTARCCCVPKPSRTAASRRASFQPTRCAAAPRRRRDDHSSEPAWLRRNRRRRVPPDRGRTAIARNWARSG